MQFNSLHIKNSGDIKHHMNKASDRPPGIQSVKLPDAGREGPIGLDESDPDFLANLGRRVRQARVERGMARTVLSRAADVSERYLAQLESGEGNASVVLLRRIAAALGMRIVDLLESGEPVTEQRLI